MAQIVAHKKKLVKWQTDHLHAELSTVCNYALFLCVLLIFEILCIKWPQSELPFTLVSLLHWDIGRFCRRYNTHAEKQDAIFL